MKNSIFIDGESQSTEIQKYKVKRKKKLDWCVCVRTSNEAYNNPRWHSNKQPSVLAVIPLVASARPKKLWAHREITMTISEIRSARGHVLFFTPLNNTLDERRRRVRVFHPKHIYTIGCAAPHCASPKCRITFPIYCNGQLFFFFFLPSTFSEPSGATPYLCLDKPQTGWKSTNHLLNIFQECACVFFFLCESWQFCLS